MRLKTLCPLAHIIILICSFRLLQPHLSNLTLVERHLMPTSRGGEENRRRSGRGLIDEETPIGLPLTVRKPAIEREANDRRVVPRMMIDKMIGDKEGTTVTLAATGEAEALVDLRNATSKL